MASPTGHHNPAQAGLHRLGGMGWECRLCPLSLKDGTGFAEIVDAGSEEPRRADSLGHAAVHTTQLCDTDGAGPFPMRYTA